MRSVWSRTTTCCTVPVAARGRCSVNMGVSAQSRSNSFGFLGVGQQQPAPLVEQGDEAVRAGVDGGERRLQPVGVDEGDEGALHRAGRADETAADRPAPAAGGVLFDAADVEHRCVSMSVASCVRPSASSSMKPRTISSAATSAARRCRSCALPARPASGTAATRALPSLTVRSMRRRFCPTTSSSSRAWFAVLRFSSRVAPACSR